MIFHIPIVLLVKEYLAIMKGPPPRVLVPTQKECSLVIVLACQLLSTSVLELTHQPFPPCGIGMICSHLFGIVVHLCCNPSLHYILTVGWHVDDTPHILELGSNMVR